jgi:DNA-binding transcriptional MerR regulator
MLGKLLSTGFNLATLPARLTLRSVRALAMTPAQASQLLAELRDASDQAVAELQQLLASVDAEMGRKTAHLSNADKRLAAELALQAAEQHLSMAAINLLRALWLTLHSTPPLPTEQTPRLMAPEPKG